MGIDTKTGKINWQHNPGYKQRSLGSPAFKDGVFFCTFGSGGGGKETAHLDVTGGKVKPLEWTLMKGLPYAPSPWSWVITCICWAMAASCSASNSRPVRATYEERLNGSKGSSKFFSSPVAGDGKLYCGSQQGDVIVVKAGPSSNNCPRPSWTARSMRPLPLAMAALYVRTENMLWCGGGKTAPVP